MTFPAQSPDLRRFPLVAGASRSVVRSPRSAAPRIRFLFVDSRVRFTLRSAYASRRTPCASLRSLRPGSGRTFTSKSSPMPGPPPSKLCTSRAHHAGRNSGAPAGDPRVEACYRPSIRSSAPAAISRMRAAWLGLAVMISMSLVRTPCRSAADRSPATPAAPRTALRQSAS